MISNSIENQHLSTIPPILKHSLRLFIDLSRRSLRKRFGPILTCIPLHSPCIIGTLVTAIKSTKTIQKLNLSWEWYHNLSIQEISSVNKVLKRLASSASLALDFEGRSEVTDRRLFGLSEAMKRLKSPKRISLCFRRCRYITDKGLETLSRNLRGLGSLRKLRLDFSLCDEISDLGLIGLGESVKKMRCLQGLDLDFESCDKIGIKGMLSLIRNLKKLVNLQIIQLTSSLRRDLHIVRLAQDLNAIPQLKYVTVKFERCFEITHAQRSEVAQVLKNHSSLYKATFSFGKDDRMIVYGKNCPYKSWAELLLIGVLSFVPVGFIANLTASVLVGTPEYMLKDFIYALFYILKRHSQPLRVFSMVKLSIYNFSGRRSS